MMKRLLLLMLLLCNIVVGAKADNLFDEELPFYVSTTKATTLTSGLYVMQNKDNSCYIYANGDEKKLYFRSDPYADAASVVRVTVSGNTCTLQTFYGRYFTAMSNETQVSTTAEAVASFTWEYSDTKEGFRFSTSSVYMSRKGSEYPKGITSTYWAAQDEAYFFLFPVTVSAPTGSALGLDVNYYLPSSTPATSLNAGSIYAIKNVGNSSYMKGQSGQTSLSTSPAYSWDNLFRVVNGKNLQHQTPSMKAYLETFYGNFIESIDALSDGGNVPVSSSTEGVATAGLFDLTLNGSTNHWFISSNTGSNIGIKYGNAVLTPYSSWRTSSNQGEYQFFEVRTEEIQPLFSTGKKNFEVSTTAATSLQEGYYVVQNKLNSYYLVDNPGSRNLQLSSTNTSTSNIVQLIPTGEADHYYIKTYSGRYVNPLVNAVAAVATGVRGDFSLAATATTGEFYIKNNDNDIYMSRNSTTFPRGVTANWKDNEDEGHWIFYPVELSSVVIDAETEYTVQLRNATGKEYNDAFSNNGRWYTNWYCTVDEPYDLYTMTLKATYNNLAFRHFMEDNTSEYADGAFAAAYGISHDKMTLTAPDGWYIKSVRMRGVSIGQYPNYIGSTAYDNSITYKKTSDGEEKTSVTSSGSGTDKLYDFINATTGTIDNDCKVYVKNVEGGVTTWEETGAADAILNGGTCYHVFKTANQTHSIAGVAAAMAMTDSVTEFTHIMTGQPTSWSFHVNGYNGSPLIMQMWVTLVKCDEVANVTITVQDEDGTELATGLKRNVRFGPNNEVYVPYDLRRDFFSSSVLESRATIESTGTATVKYANGSLPFRIASSATDKENLYYVGFGDDTAPRFISYTADGEALPYADDTKDVEAEWFGFSGNPYDGYLITNYSAGADKYLTTDAPGNGVEPKFVADADYNTLSQCRRWYPSRSVYTHTDGKKYNGAYGVYLPATAATHFYLAPIKDNGRSFADCDVTWHYTRLGNCDEASNLTYQSGRNEANQYAALSIYEIRDWDLKLINSEYRDYEDGKANVTLYDVRELQTLALQDSHLARDFVNLSGTVVGDTYDHTEAGGYTREERYYTNTLFRVSPPELTTPVYYGLAVRYNDWRYLSYDATKDYIAVPNAGTTNVDDAFSNDGACWFFRGNAWDGFQIYTIGAGTAKTLVTSNPVGADNAGRDVKVSFQETASIDATTQSNNWLFHRAINTTATPKSYYDPYDTDYIPFNLTSADFNTYYKASEKDGYQAADTRQYFQLNNRADHQESGTTTNALAYWNTNADVGSAFILKPVTELTYVYNLREGTPAAPGAVRYTKTVRVLHGLDKTLDFSDVDGVNWLRDFCTYQRKQDFNRDGTPNDAVTSIKLWTINLPNDLSPAEAVALRAANEDASGESVARVTRDIFYNFTLFKTAADVTAPTDDELYYLAARADDNHTVVLYNGASQTISAPLNTTDDSDNTISNSKGGGLDKQKWFFAGNPYDGFVFYNKAAASTQAMAAGTAHSGNVTFETYDVNDASHTFLWRPDSCYVAETESYGFRYHERNCFNLFANAYDGYRANKFDCLNRNSADYNIAFLSGNDIDSRFFLVPVSTTQEYTYQIVDAEGNVVAGPHTKTIVAGDSETYTLAGAYPDLIRDFCTYSLDGAPVDMNASITHDNTDGDGIKETFNILYTWNGPFELSTPELPVWYLMNMTPPQGSLQYLIYDTSRTDETDHQLLTGTTGWNDELNLADNYVMKHIINGTGLWAFEGDPYTYFKVLNRSDQTKALNATNVDNNGTYAPLLAAKASAVKWEVRQNTYGESTTGFSLRAVNANDNDFLNYRANASGNISYWQSSGATTAQGSQFFVEKMTPYVKTYIERYTVAPEQTFYGVASNNERTALGELVADIATIDQSGSTYTYKNESDGLADASIYVFNTKKTEPHTGSFRLLFKYRDVYASLSNNGTYYASTTNAYVPGTSTTAQLWANIGHNSTDVLMRNLSSVVCFEKESEDATAGTVNGYLTVQGMKSPATTTNSNLNFSNSGTGEVRIFKTDYAPYSFISTNPDETSMTNKTFYHRNNQNYVQTWLGNEAGSTLYVVPATKIQVKTNQAIDGRFYATLAVPFPISTGSSKSSAYYLDNTDGEALTVNDSGTRASVRTNQIAGVPAGTPVILTATNTDASTSNEAFFQLDIPSAAVAATYSTDVSNNLLQGCYMPTPQTTVTNTFAAKEKLYAFAQSKTFEGTTEVGFFPYSGTNLAANRIYLVYDHEAAKNPSASAPAAILLDIDGASLDVAISSAGYSTLYYDLPLVVPEGIEAAIVSVSDEQLNIDYCYPAGSVIPAETGVLLRGEEGRYVFTLTDEDGTTYAGNQLRGTLTDALTDEGGTAYKLAVGEDGLPGFYLGDPDGGRFVNQAYKAYLFLTEGQLVRGFNFDDAVSTGVGSNNLTSGEDNAGKNLPVFDAQGRRVGKQKLMPGVYIMNGKKVFIK